jgi:hypothetical protein
MGIVDNRIVHRPVNGFVDAGPGGNNGYPSGSTPGSFTGRKPPQYLIRDNT